MSMYKNNFTNTLFQSLYTYLYNCKYIKYTYKYNCNYLYFKCP